MGLHEQEIGTLAYTEPMEVSINPAVFQMTQLENMRSARPMSQFPSHCGSTHLRRTPTFNNNSSEIPNTFLSALDWVGRHTDTLKKFVQLAKNFPNLLKSQELLFFSMFLNSHYQNRLIDEQEKAVEKLLHSPHARRNPVSYDLMSPAKISVYVTGEVSDTQWTNTDFVTRELASHFTVHSDPPSPRFPGFQEEEDAVISSNVMVFVLSEKSLVDRYCLHQLRVAISQHVPVVLIREAEGVIMPEMFPDENIPIILSRPVTALADVAEKSPVLLLDNSDRPESGRENKGMINSMDRIQQEKENVPERSILVLDWLKSVMPQSMVFAFEHRSQCMSRIVTRIRNVALGEVLLDGFGDVIPTDLPISPDMMRNIPCSRDPRVAEMADSLLACPTSSLWGGTPSCPRCGQLLPLTERMSTPAPIPADPTLSKFLHHSQKRLQGTTEQDQGERPSTAPGRYSKRSQDSFVLDSDSFQTEEILSERPRSARSVTFSDTDEIREFDDNDDEDVGGDEEVLDEEHNEEKPPAVCLLPDNFSVN